MLVCVVTVGREKYSFWWLVSVCVTILVCVCVCVVSERLCVYDSTNSLCKDLFKIKHLALHNK